MREDLVSTVEKDPRARLYFNQLFCNNTLEEIKLDHRLLKIIVQQGPRNEGKLASYLGMQTLSDAVFQAALTRLADRGLIVRKTKEWNGKRGVMVELSDECKELVASNNGVYWGKQNIESLVKE
jgi:DNA-binding MarR family transcriptional regulator